LPYNTDTASINLALNDFREAFTKCPNAVVVAGGYSQGAAIMSAAIPMLTAAQQAKIAGVVLFGDTRYKQDNHQIPGFPTSKTLIYCNAGDGVCDGSLEVTLGHLAYTGDVPGAAAFLQKQITAASA
jgi:cutinase